MPGIYRQTTETTGTYNPLKKHLYRDQQILPSKNCATQKVLPSHHAIDVQYDHARKPNKDQSFDTIRNSYSLPHLKNVLNRDVSAAEYEHFYQYHVPLKKDNVRSEQKTNHHRREPPLPPIDYNTRPYTPPEKRYSSKFGTTRGSGILEKQRPRSGCIYDNVYVPSDDFCVAKVNSDRNLVHSANVRVSDFPALKFNQMYIQDQFDY